MTMTCHRIPFRLAVLGSLLALVTTTLALAEETPKPPVQETPKPPEGVNEKPYQRPLEVQIAERFKEAVSDLFKAWLAKRPEELAAAGVGTQGDCPDSPAFGKTADNWFQFITCTDAV